MIKLSVSKRLFALIGFVLLSLVACTKEAEQTAPIPQNTKIDKENHPPTANSQTITTDEDTPYGVTLSATDADDNRLTYSIVDQPGHGTLSGTGNTFTYTPVQDYFGEDSFTFKVNDGIVDSSVGSIAIVVKPVQDAPVALTQNVSVQEDKQKSISLSASDAENDPLTYTITQQPTHGTLAGSGKSRSYTPAINYFGPDSFTFKVNDGHYDSAQVTVSISVSAVNDAPTAISQTVATQEDTSVAIKLSGSDIENNPLTYSIFTPPAHGQLSGTGADRTYQPAENFSGADAFTFKTNDGKLDSVIGTISIIVRRANDAPVAIGQNIYIEPSTGKRLSISATDVDSQSLTYTVVSLPMHGTLLDKGGGTYLYTPREFYIGRDAFTFKANDGSVDSNTATVSLYVGTYSLAMGAYHSCAVEDSGVKCWGDNRARQAIVPPLSKARMVAAGLQHTCALHASGVKCWGDTRWGLTSVPSLANPTSISAGALHTCALDQSGVKCWGNNEEEQTNVPTLSHPRVIAAGGYHSCAIHDAGVKCWGSNDHGQTSPPRLSNPRALVGGVFHTCAIDDSGVKCWGKNDKGQSTVPALSHPRRLAAGDNYTCALDDAGAKCWGDNSYGQRAVPPLTDPREISGGWFHACALDQAKVKCWGQNTFAQKIVPTLFNPRAISSNCMIGSTGAKCWEFGQTVPPLLNPRAVASGAGHHCALDRTGMHCWGQNDMGQTDVPSLSNVVTMALGDKHTCALHDAGVKCWGDPQTITVPPLSNPRAIAAGSTHSCALDDAGMKCWGNNEYGENTVPALANPRGMAVGWRYSCALDDTGVKCWGWGKPTPVPALNNPTTITGGLTHVCVTDDSGVKCWGSPSTDPLAVTVPPLANIKALVSGLRTSCAIDNTGVKCWGYPAPFLPNTELSFSLF